MLHYTMETISKLIAKSNILFEMKEVCKPSVIYLNINLGYASNLRNWWFDFIKLDLIFQL